MNEKSKQLTINKCSTLLDCTNTDILMYCIYLQYTPSVRYYLHTHSFGSTHIHDVFALGYTTRFKMLQLGGFKNSNSHFGNRKGPPGVGGCDKMPYPISLFRVKRNSEWAEWKKKKFISNSIYFPIPRIL